MHGKGINIRNVPPILRAFHECGVINHVYLLYGLPQTTDEETEETFRGLQEVWPYCEVRRMSWFIPSKELDLYRRPEYYGIYIGQPYHISDSMGFDALGRYNLKTSFFNFRSRHNGCLLTRLEDCMRYVPGIRRAFAQNVVHKLHSQICFLGASVPDMTMVTHCLWDEPNDSWMGDTRRGRCP